MNLGGSSEQGYLPLVPWSLLVLAYEFRQWDGDSWPLGYLPGTGQDLSQDCDLSPPQAVFPAF